MDNRFDVILLGLAPQGLFLLQEFSKAGSKVLAVGFRGQVGLFSRYGHLIAIDKLEQVKDILCRYYRQGLAIHVASDPILNYLLENHTVDYQSHQIFPTRESARIFCDKMATEELARSLGINCTKSYKLSEVNITSFDDYPAIVKWNRRYGGEPFKTAIVKDQYDLKAIKDRYASMKDLIVQRYIPGGPATSVSCAGYYEDGKPRAEIVVKQKRQYPSGISSFVEEYSGPFSDVIHAWSNTIMKKTHYSGFGEAEYKIDEEFANVRLIEVNPRACGWIKALKGKYRNICGEPYNIADYPPGKVCWVNLVRDIRAILDSIRKNRREISWRSILSDYARHPIIDLFERDDPVPFIAQFAKVFRRGRN